MEIVLKLNFLFLIGAMSGWVLELVFRHWFSSANPEHKWINPGFCVGPYVPLYGFGLCILYLLASIPCSRILQLILMAFSMTAIEYIAGIMCLKIYKLRLWDYSGEKWNLNGLICPKFSLAWGALGALYCFFAHEHIVRLTDRFIGNIYMVFLTGVIMGVFIIDVVYSAQLLSKLKKFAVENEVIVKYENLKAHIRSHHDSAKKKYNFLFAFRSELDISEHLKEMRKDFESLRKNIRKK